MVEAGMAAQSKTQRMKCLAPTWKLKRFKGAKVPE
jgi:hypothetical protein